MWHPLPLIAASLYLLSILFTLGHGDSPIGLVILGAVLVLFAVTIVASYQTGTLQMYQGRGASRQNAPRRYWFHLAIQTALWLAFNVVFGLAVWFGLKRQ
jgi:formate hydrogenlyase subunit 3/multisubunit Na+/H+ antiporter MnhD subunit